MQRSNPETVTLNNILITEELFQRPARSANLQADDEAMQTFSQQIAQDAKMLLQTLVDLAIEQCQAGTAGVSLLETTPSGEEVFCWAVLAGTLAPYAGEIIPRDLSPCGVCLERGTPQLFRYPDRYFSNFQFANIPIVEGLGLPLIANGQALGTLWILSHEEERQFDPEDLRIMTGLANLTATAVLAERQNQELRRVNAALEAEIAERKQAEMQTRTLISNLPGGAAFVVDRNLRYLLAEGEALAIAGFKPEDFVGKTLFEALPPELVAQYEPLYRQALTGEPFEHEHQAHDRTYISSGTPLRAENGEIYAVLAVSYDNTDRKKAEASLRQSEAKYRSLFETMDEGLSVLELIYDSSGKPVDMRWLEANPAFEKITGLKNVAGRLCSEFVPSEDYWLETYDRVVKTGESIRYENFHAGIQQWYRTHTSRIGGAESRVVANLFEDITDRKRHEANLAFLAEISQDLVHLTNIDETMEAIGAKIGRHFNVDRVLFSEISEDQQTGRVSHEWHQSDLPGMRGSYRTKDYFSPEFERLHRAGEIAVVHDTAKDDRVDAARYAALGVGAFVGVPLIRQSKWRFYFSLLDAAPHDWREDEIELLRELTSRIWTRLERARAEESLRQSEAKYRSLFESIDEGYLLCEVIFNENEEPIDILYLEANPAAIRLAGQDFSGRRMREIDPNYEDYWYELIGRVALTGESVRAEHYAEPHGRWFDFYASKVGGSESRRVASIFQDTTDRKLHERQQEFLLQLSDALRPIADPIAIQETASRMAAEHLDIGRVTYCEIRYEPDIVVIVERDWTRRGMPLIAAGRYRMDDFGPFLAQELTAGRPAIVADAATDLRLSQTERENWSQFEIVSNCAIPVIKQGRFVAYLAAQDNRPHAWTDREIELLRELSERTWAAVERARAETALRESEAKYRSLFNSIDEGFHIIELIDDEAGEVVDYRFLEGNSAFERLTGLKNTAGRLGSEIAPKTESYWIEAYDRVARTGEPLRIENYNEDTKRWYSAYASRIDGAGSRQIVIVFNDITDRKQAEAERLQLIREQAAREQERQRAESLAELDRAKTVFFSNISHEFRTPLTLLLAPLQDALNDRAHRLPPAQQERLELAHRNSLRLLKLVNTLLDFSRIEAGRMEAIYEPTDLALFTAELASVFRSAIEQAGLRLIVDCPPLPESVYVDRQMWEKIVLNLLSNAFKFTFSGGITVTFRSRSIADSQNLPQDLTSHPVILEIQDTGTGIAPEHLPHLFERFYQVRGAEARSQEGSGIGLALVAELVRLQGGTIAVSSTLGQGTCFTIVLPFGSQHLPPAQIRSAHPATATPSEAASSVQPAELGRSIAPVIRSDARILLVDDNADMRDYLSHILSASVQVEAVADGRTALLAAQTNPPDLILSDVMMPGLDGFELLHALRNDPRTQEIPIILLSARAGEEAIVDGLEAGADDYLIKPFSAQELISRVTAHLQTAQRRKEALQQERILNHRKDEFMSIVSHELNTPLVSILGWTRMLRSNSPTPAMLSKALDTIERNATLQAKLVQDLLDISRITTGKLRLHPQLLDLQSVIETAIATVTQPATDKGIHLTWQATVTEPIVVMGDRDRLSQVLINLLTNAIKFTPEFGSVKVELSIVNNANSDITNVEIQVIDTGIGIGADFLPHVFDRFRQAEGLHSVKGLGLGLAIARHLVELHNGTIQAESAGEGQGATFTVRLPLLPNSPLSSLSLK